MEILLEEIIAATDVVQYVMKHTEGFNDIMFKSTFAMIAEEWCLANGKDVTDLFRELAEISEMINEQLGRYGKS